MRFPSLTVLILLCATGDLGAQSRRTVFQVQAVAAFAEVDFWGGGAGIWRRSEGRLAYGLSASPGISSDGQFTLRAEASVIFNLDPGKRTGVAPYGGGGIVWRATPVSSEGFLLVLVGVESSPAAATGWFAEVGIGAGVRGSFGWRIRR